MWDNPLQHHDPESGGEAVHLGFAGQVIAIYGNEYEQVNAETELHFMKERAKYCTSATELALMNMLNSKVNGSRMPWKESNVKAKAGARLNLCGDAPQTAALAHRPRDCRSEQHGRLSALERW